MERNAVCWWSVDGAPSPLSTDPEEIAIYMRLAHAIAADRDQEREPAELKSCALT